LYIHLGNNFIISSEKVIALLNIRYPSEDLKDIIDIAKLENKLISLCKEGKEKTLIICNDKVYKSPISSITLSKRVSNYYKEV
jgi:regulator of extracellular matrix RemA (YlzA/DUF370 family)